MADFAGNLVATSLRLSGAQGYDGHIVVFTSNISIAASTPVITPITVLGRSVGPTQALTFTVQGLQALEGVFVAFTQGKAIIEELVHDGRSFSGTFTGQSNSRVALNAGLSGWTYTILRDGGWRDDVSLLVVAAGSTGISRRVLTWPLVPSLK